MERNEVLEKLQNNAREISSLEEWFGSCGEKRLSEYACVWRLINFKVQEIVRSAALNEVENLLNELRVFLCNRMEYYRDNRITVLSELYGAAIDGLVNAECLLQDYLL